MFCFTCFQRREGSIKLRLPKMSKIRIFSIVVLVVMAQSSYAGLIGVDQVQGVNSLYSSDWGHPYNTGSGNEFNAIGRGDPARAFEVSGSAYGFVSGLNLHITASGCVVDAGISCTGPDHLGGDFRGLPVYSLIGIWSTDANSIIPVDMISVNPAFLISSLLDLVVPDHTSPLYLFMATNDGMFVDNSGAYDVRIEQVPVPSVLWLMMAGLMFFNRKCKS